MRSLPTDRKILKCIYEMYELDYPGKENGEARGKNDPYLPIKVHDVAARLGCSAEMLFGLLYYHLDAKYRYEQGSDSMVHLFSLKLGSEIHCVNFPYLAAVLAEKDTEHKRQLWSLAISLMALVLSFASIVVHLLSAK